MQSLQWIFHKRCAAALCRVVNGSLLKQALQTQPAHPALSSSTARDLIALCLGVLLCDQ